jgi:hypothetical protein
VPAGSGPTLAAAPVMGKAVSKAASKHLKRSHNNTGKLAQKLKRRKLNPEELALKEKGDKEYKVALVVTATNELVRRIQNGRNWEHTVQPGVWHTEYATTCREVSKEHAVNYNTLKRRWLGGKQKTGPKSSVSDLEKRLLKEWADAQLKKQRTPTVLEIKAQVLRMTQLRGSPVEVTDWWVAEWGKN